MKKLLKNLGSFLKSFFKLLFKTLIKYNEFILEEIPNILQMVTIFILTDTILRFSTFTNLPVLVTAVVTSIYILGRFEQYSHRINDVTMREKIIYAIYIFITLGVFVYILSLYYVYSNPEKTLEHGGYSIEQIKEILPE